MCVVTWHVPRYYSRCQANPQHLVWEMEKIEHCFKAPKGGVCEQDRKHPDSANDPIFGSSRKTIGECPECGMFERFTCSDFGNRS